jgi:exopolysaccharide biosynthesis polyprenyl glycosylphosphotransferase
MNIAIRREPFVLLLGDVVVLAASLWLMLWIRYLSFPAAEQFFSHLQPFSILFVIWLLVFYIAGLYEKHTLILQSKLPGTILRAQLFNSVIAILFFYLIPYFGITPKTNLFIYLVFSFVLIWAWRRLALTILGVRHPARGILVGQGEAVQELYDEVNGNRRYNLEFSTFIELDSISADELRDRITDLVQNEKTTIVVIDMQSKVVGAIVDELYALIFAGVRFVDVHQVYEEIFDRVPLSLIHPGWFLENLSLYPRITYTILKRGMDIVVALLLGIITLPLYPFVALAIKLDDGGSVFYSQARVGQHSRLIWLVKFRTMTSFAPGDLLFSQRSTVTRVGKFLRRTRIDELPQLWNVLRGGMSLIGPRPEVPALVSVYESDVSYYNVRYLIKPGLSGWAQIKQVEPPKFAPQSEATRVKLSYDLYYLKNRSIMLDLKIALRTIHQLLSRSGI